MVFNFWMYLFQQIKSLMTELSVYRSRYIVSVSEMKAWLIVFRELCVWLLNWYEEDLLEEISYQELAITI